MEPALRIILHTQYSILNTQYSNVGISTMTTNTQAYLEIGRQFYAWHKDSRVQFEYGNNSKDLELEVERIVGLIDYVLEKKEKLLNGSQK